MKRLITLIALVLVFKFGSAQELETEYQNVVLTFIEYFKNENKTKLSTLVSYPLKRDYPLPDIKNEEEFLSRYKEIFDDRLINTIINSDVKKDWSAVGWRGIMLNHGALWLDYDGRLIAVNYQSSIERNKREKLIKNDRNSIHESLKEFERPILILETKKFRIRIDELSNDIYRYASWSINSTMNDKPDLILKNGSCITEGSGGNHRYEFVNGNYRYECLINVLGTEETPPADLRVYQNENEILHQSAQIIRN